METIKDGNKTKGFASNPQNINRAGRPPKQWTWASLIREATEEKEKDGIPVKKKIVVTLITKALSGDINALTALMNRTDGFPVAKHEIKESEEEEMTDEQLDEAIKKLENKLNARR